MKCCGLISVAGALAVSLTGCADAPRNVYLEKRGPPPQLDQAVAVAHQTLKRTLKDYDSMKDFAVVGELAPITATTLGWNFEEAWMLCVEFNAKNSYGGYTGIQERGFPLRAHGGELVVVHRTNWITYTGTGCSQ